MKTAKAAAVSKNLARERERLSDTFSRDPAILCSTIRVIGTDGAGLYCTMNTGDTMLNHPRFQLRPLTNFAEDTEALALGTLGWAWCCCSSR
ncbi:hypothetical protein ABIF07_003631 [Bradyrhizobium elkanii]|uniref:hypothetical protein n=1 Tax=Bradyrhizobium elkanii TaxID=29448 RepID=UPI00216A4AD1|nr:hypothetical protein [Bradyrhizobium elkanii]MCS3689341.1 hypothetical protein [Bradyrhizobium elkanii]